MTCADHRAASAPHVGYLRAPFGGSADAGWGREGGTVSREFFTEPKAVVMAINNDPEVTGG